MDMFLFRRRRSEVLAHTGRGNFGLAVVVPSSCSGAKGSLSISTTSSDGTETAPLALHHRHVLSDHPCS